MTDRNEIYPSLVLNKKLSPLYEEKARMGRLLPICAQVKCAKILPQVWCRRGGRGHFHWKLDYILEYCPQKSTRSEDSITGQMKSPSGQASLHNLSRMFVSRERIPRFIGSDSPSPVSRGIYNLFARFRDVDSGWKANGGYISPWFFLGCVYRRDSTF